MTPCYELTLEMDELEDGGYNWLVTVPSFPEITTFGDDIEEALRAGLGAIEEAIAGRIARGESVSDVCADAHKIRLCANSYNEVMMTDDIDRLKAEIKTLTYVFNDLDMMYTAKVAFYGEAKAEIERLKGQMEACQKGNRDLLVKYTHIGRYCDMLRAAMQECLDNYYHELGHMPYCIQAIDEAMKSDGGYMSPDREELYAAQKDIAKLRAVIVDMSTVGEPTGENLKIIAEIMQEETCE